MMRRIAEGLLLLFVLTIPWEYSLEMGEGLGNIARIVGLLLLAAAIPAVLESRRARVLGPMQWAVVAFYLWFCCTYFWTLEPATTLDKLRAYFQEFMIVWLVWEFAATPEMLKSLLRSWVAGSWILAILTLANYASPEAAAQQIRFVAEGVDPNDAARFLDLGFPLAAWLYDAEKRWPLRFLAGGYLPLGLFAVLLTASRGGFLTAVAAFAGCGILLLRGHRRRAIATVAALPVLVAMLWAVVPHESFARLATISEQAQGGDLNDRTNIWSAGWDAFVKAPFFGHGAGAFTSAAGLAPGNTAHNTPLTIAVTGGVFGLLLAAAILATVVWSLARVRGPLQIALGTSFVVWLLASTVSTVEESRTTWLLLATIAVAPSLKLEEKRECGLWAKDAITSENA